MIDRNRELRKCTVCNQLISIPPFGLGECSIHETTHKQKDYCPDWQPLHREMAYCAPSCKLNGRTLTERPPDTTAAAPESKPLRDWPPGRALRTELDTDEGIVGAPIYFVVSWSEVVRLDPRTRSRTQCDLPGGVKMCEVAL